jgi:hypothetical protein
MRDPVHFDTETTDGVGAERRRPPSDVESNDSNIQDETKKSANDDPFGSEEVAEVKYRTMKWWYVSVPLYNENRYLKLTETHNRHCGMREMTVRQVQLLILINII